MQIFTSFWSLRRLVFKVGSECPSIWSNGALQNIKFQALSLRVSGVRGQGSGVRIKKKYKLKPET